MILVFAFFAVLGILSFSVKAERDSILGRSKGEWFLDWTGLVMQGAVVPALRVTALFALLTFCFSKFRGSIDIPAPASFALCFIGVDYLYYWNHRLLHHPRLWFAHQVHHSATRFDFVITSRNTIWTPFLIIYLWANGLFLFLLKDPAPFALAAAITAGLDLWRHTRFSPKRGSPLERVLSPWLILPHDYIWHHSRDIYDVNFGANFSLWDRIHGTYYAPTDPRTPVVGSPTALSFLAQLLWPMEKRKS